MKRNVGILLFEDVEVLDFAGPFEVFAVASEIHDHSLFEVFTVAKTEGPIKAVNGLSVNPDYTFRNCPDIDILIITGGSGTRALLNDETLLGWVSVQSASAAYTLCICSGARLLGKLGLLDGLPFCTHHGVYEHMKEVAPTAIPQPELRFVATTDRMYTSGGISAGIDLSFHILEKIYGKGKSQATAEYMEYDLKTYTANLNE